ncbi:MAG: tRNA pseudouridine(38-40) synthase TruA, partial [Methanobrevibacter sp.]|nr:tRNA pseudouridine(38-40) synthase TruA [Methanobrevibacter sp.]
INSEISSSKLENSYSSVNYSPVFVDFYGESFLWNMIRKIMRVFLLVGKRELEIAEVEKYLNPENKISIKTLAPENLILMDTKYKNIKFKYDDYACEGFRRTLIDNLIDYKLKSSIETHMLNIMKNIKE